MVGQCPVESFVKRMGIFINQAAESTEDARKDKQVAKTQSYSVQGGPKHFGYHRFGFQPSI
jgi:hypothetical protein